MSNPEVINLVYDILRGAPVLGLIVEWKKVTGLITGQAPGCSVGMVQEIFEPYTGDLDQVEAQVRITLWVIDEDPAEGENDVRNLARDCKLVLTSNRTLGGSVEDSFVKSIKYITVAGEMGSNTYTAEVDFKVTYYPERAESESVGPVEPVEQLNYNVITD